MTAVLTMMVRDEADIIAATIEHHLAQGIDHILVTDNASIDGTREILAEYAAAAPVTVFDEAEHRKQQGAVVTRMARLAHDRFGADWVVNGDADEFVVPLDPARTLRDVLEAMPQSLGAFPVPVTNLVGRMARQGSGLRRLVHRDHRTEAQLATAGLIAHPTQNTIHVGSSDVEVAQGNHRTSIEPVGEVPAELAIEVLHLPWRSIAQLRRKTENMGRGYEANPELHPSPKHHGMRDWRRMQGGVLDNFLALRSPTQRELDSGEFPRDTRLLEMLEAMRGDCVLPGRLDEALVDSDDDALPDSLVEEMRTVALAIRDAEEPLYDALTGMRMHGDALEQQRLERAAEHDGALVSLESARADAEQLREQLEAVLGERQALADRLQEIEAHPAMRFARFARRGLSRS